MLSLVKKLIDHRTSPAKVYSYARVASLKWAWYRNEYAAEPWPYALPKACPMLLLGKQHLAKNRLAATLADVAVAAWLSHYGPHWFTDPLLSRPLHLWSSWMDGYAICPVCDRGLRPPTVEWWPAQALTAFPVMRESGITWFVVPLVKPPGPFSYDGCWFEPRGISLLSAIYKCPQYLQLTWLGVSDGGGYYAGESRTDALLRPPLNGPLSLPGFSNAFEWKFLGLHPLRMRRSPTIIEHVQLAPPTEETLRTSEGKSVCWGQIIVGLHPSAQNWALADYDEIGGSYARA